jgi:hypothetical protein
MQKLSNRSLDEHIGYFRARFSSVFQADITLSRGIKPMSPL